MKVLLKILLFPVTLILNILLGMSKFVLFFGSFFLNILAFFFFLGAIISLFSGDLISIGLPLLFMGYLLSPWGLASVGIWLIAKVEGFNNWLKTV